MTKTEVTYTVIQNERKDGFIYQPFYKTKHPGDWACVGEPPLCFRTLSEAEDWCRAHGNFVRDLIP